MWDPSDPPFDPAASDDPHAGYRALRRKSPVHRTPLGFWVLARHAECRAVLADERFHSDLRLVDRAPARRRRDAGEGAVPPFLFLDPPDHTRLRSLVQRAFTPRVVEQLRAKMVRLCDELVDKALDAREIDLVANLAYPLPVRIIAELLGVPPADHVQFHEWSRSLARGLDPDFVLPPGLAQQRLAARAAFGEYFQRLIAFRRTHPGDDLLSGLVDLQAAGGRLSESELISTCILLLVAGHETTVNLISGAVLALLARPDQAVKMLAGDSDARLGIEELVRYVSPVQLTARVAVEDVEVAGQTIGAGQAVLVLVGSANRDPAAFDDPEALDVCRQRNPHLGFGFGVHHCLGAPLARLEAQAALATLFRRCRVELAGTPTYRPNLVLRGLDALPVRVSAT